MRRTWNGVCANVTRSVTTGRRRPLVWSSIPLPRFAGCGAIRVTGAPWTPQASRHSAGVNDSSCVPHGVALLPVADKSPGLTSADLARLLFVGLIEGLGYSVDGVVSSPGVLEVFPRRGDLGYHAAKGVLTTAIEVSRRRRALCSSRLTVAVRCGAPSPRARRAAPGARARTRRSGVSGLSRPDA